MFSRDYSLHREAHPFGAGLRPFKIAPGNFVEPTSAPLPYY